MVLKINDVVGYEEGKTIKYGRVFEIWKSDSEGWIEVVTEIDEKQLNQFSIVRINDGEKITGRSGDQIIMEQNVVLLFTPGLDSFLADRILSKKYQNLHRVYFDIRSAYGQIEIDFLNTCYQYNYIDIDSRLFLGDLEEGDSNIPNRNLLMVSLVASKYKPDIIYINGMKDDSANDQDKRLFDDYSKILSMSSGKEIKIKSLFWKKEKSEAVEEFVENYPEPKNMALYELLVKTYSCFSKQSIEQDIEVMINGSKAVTDVAGCQKCPACFRRNCALSAVGIMVPFSDIQLARSYRKRVNKKEYPKRHSTIKRYLKYLEENQNENN